MPVQTCGMGHVRKIRPNDLHTLTGIVRGPGYYATPSQDRIARLTASGLVKNLGAGRLKPTLKGRLVALLTSRRSAA